MRYLLNVVLLSTGLSSCGGQAAHESADPPLSGKLLNTEGKTIVFEKLASNSIVPLDTIIPAEDGSYKLESSVQEAGFYRLFADQQNFVILIMDSTSRITLHGDVENLPATYQIEGSDESKDLQELYAVMRRHDRTRDSLQQVLQANLNDPNIESIRQNLQKEYEANEASRGEYLAAYGEEHHDQLSSLIAVSSLKYDDYPALFQKVYSNLQENYPGSPLVEPFLQAYREMARLAPGSPAPEIIMNTPEGESISLSSLRGKYVLVDFWASWCRPCRIENPNVVRIYNQYKNKGFEILGVSLDKDRDQWIKAITDDKLTWKHVSDLGFWSSSVVKSYGISGIPFTVLVDPEGNIIAKGLRGEALEQKLEEILGS